MEPLAVLGTDRLNRRAVALDLDRDILSCDGPPGGGEDRHASPAFGKCDARDAKGGPHHNRPGNLKPNIYYKAQDFALGTVHASFSFDEPARGRAEDEACDR